MTAALPSLAPGGPGQGPAPTAPPSGGASAPREARSPGDYPRAGMAMRFHVSLDEWKTDLGMWSSCRGLQVQFGAKEIAEGGQYLDSDLLPDRVTFSTVTLERMMTQADSPRLQTWLARVAANWTGYEYEGGAAGPYTGQNVTIRLFDHQGRVVTRWVLANAFPKEWVGPDLDARSGSVAIERISFDHSGFLDLDSAPAEVAP
ncbi:T4-like virus tail tube protein gp19 [Streptomyces sp. ADI96-02]|uniref:phage tail protein n=1 Tax=unclassified Streptomyces TaxID=2593676 RepID=UPI000F5571E3|nr:phage tail protein [Streptomyces sp. ADI96-02]RPK67547.1 T4-like virus tail tube protein gp19 [Streptomyces sp. ADI96-02]